MRKKSTRKLLQQKISCINFLGASQEFFYFPLHNAALCRLSRWLLPQFSNKLWSGISCEKWSWRKSWLKAPWKKINWKELCRDSLSGELLMRFSEMLLTWDELKIVLSREQLWLFISSDLHYAETYVRKISYLLKLNRINSKL